jgi:hypothetical protein
MTIINEPSKIEIELDRRLMTSSIEPIPPIQCADGFSVSVQASAFHYCTPRNNEGPWDTVELGFPNAPIPELFEYSESENPDAMNSVWGFVPMNLVVELITKHGGLKKEM